MIMLKRIRKELTVFSASDRSANKKVPIAPLQREGEAGRQKRLTVKGLRLNPTF